MRIGVGGLVAAVCVLAVPASAQSAGLRFVGGAGLPATAAGDHAASGDALVVKDSRIGTIHALDGSLLYSRDSLKRPWMRVVDGRTSRARGMPRGAGAVTNVGRDASGRVVVTVPVPRVLNHRLVNTTWWLYDIVADRARRVVGLTSGTCAPTLVAVWRSRLAYNTRWCSKTRRNGVFLRSNGRTRRVSRGDARRLVLRGGTLAAQMEAGDGDTELWRLAENDRRCATRLARTYLPEEYGRGGLWLVGRTVISWDFDAFATDAGALVGTRLLGDCGRSGPTGVFEGPQLPPRSAGGRAIDGEDLYFGDVDGIYRRSMPSSFRIKPPANDDFAAAQPITDLPVTLTPTIGNATIEAGEPDLASGSVWYAFQAQTTQTVYFFSWSPYQVLAGADLDSLVLAGVVPADGQWTLDAVAGQVYWIAVGCRETCYLPVQLTVDTRPPY